MGIIDFSIRNKKARAEGGEGGESSSKIGGLSSLIQQEIKLQPDSETLLKNGLKEGISFYTQYNESRLKLAFDSFDSEMRKALFELIFLLHVNDAGLSEIKYTATRKDTSSAIPRLYEEEARINLYMEGAPFGIKGMGSLSPVYRQSFEAFIQETYGRSVPKSTTDCPIACLQSIGSIGTIGHKSADSDLDLQVIYDLRNRNIKSEDWNDWDFFEVLMKEHGWWVEHFQEQKGFSSSDLRNHDILHTLSNEASDQISMDYPLLYKYLVDGGASYRDDLANPQKKGLGPKLVDELMRLLDHYSITSQKSAVKKKEALFKERVGRIQQYITEKYPSAEIYMFICPLDMYKAGRYTSSLVFKESSGSAYELILNYETLMPGIQFTSGIPTHFVFPKLINNDSKFFQQLNTYVNFEALDFFREIAPSLVDLGNTPDLGLKYVVDHSGAVYWEAFKASSGNLPKATLNLLRYEMLLEAHLQKTNIQIIKEPEILNVLISPKSGDSDKDRAELENNNTGVPTWVLLDLEEEHPMLLQDPWWLRYKALKIGFGEEKGVVGLIHSERAQISKIIDLSFALHIRISDVFTKPGDTREFNSHREKVLVRFLELAFPPKTGKREFLKHVFMGEVRAVKRFESDLKFHFRWALERTQKKIEQLNLSGLGAYDKELLLWHQYFEHHFDPEPNVVQKSIMKNLAFPRGRVNIGYKIGEGWFFKSIQRESKIGKRFDTFGIMDHLPEELILIEGASFLYCLAHCIVNGYYGIINPGTLNESRTALEFDGKYMNMDNDLDNTAAFVRPDHIDRILDRILKFFPYQYVHYTDYIRKERKVTGVYLFFNLWKFGSLSILYRDNLNTWYCDDINHPEIVENATALRENHQAMVMDKSLHETISRFFEEKALYIDEIDLAAWVNPNSVETHLVDTNFEEKESFLAEAFTMALYRSHTPKNIFAQKKQV